MSQQGNYGEAATQLAAFLKAGPKPARFGPDAAYLRFKATEALYTKNPGPENTERYLDAARDYIRRYPGHRSVFEAHFRLGEYYQGREEFLPAIEAYERVARDPEFRLRADFATLQCTFSLLEAPPGAKDRGALTQTELSRRVAASLERFWQDAAKFAKDSPRAISRVPLQDYYGKVRVMQAVFLSRDGRKNDAEMVALLEDFEEKYPKQKDAFLKVARLRLAALTRLGRLQEVEKDVQAALKRFKGEEQTQLFTGMPDTWLRRARQREAEGDDAGAATARRAALRIYESRWQRQRDGEEAPSNQFKYQLAQLYLDLGQNDKALPLFTDLQDGAYSLVALAGLGTLAGRAGDYPTALGYWQRALKDTQAGDPLWFRGTYELSRLYLATGNREQACKLIRSTGTMLPRLGDARLKKQIQEQIAQSCGQGD
jgi:tetratricopeptide (TPR) repeat protein